MKDNINNNNNNSHNTNSTSAIGSESQADCTVQTDQPAVLVSDHYGTWAITEQLGKQS